MTLGGVTLPNPNGLKESKVVTGGYNTTMNGSVRRAIRNRKRVWSLYWNTLSETDVTSINNLVDQDTTLAFVNTDVTPNISATVHIDIGDRDYIPGTGKYISSVEITLIEA